jgi:pSer/pThr/pTyr-binding forkhead associated (FHA) protein
LTLARAARSVARVSVSPSEPCVTYRDAEGRLVVHALRRSPVTIGRSTRADICLRWDTRVSRLHAQLELVGEDPAIDWTVVDGESRNGSYVNGERIRGRAHLREGDGLSVGTTLLVFRVGEAGTGDDDDPASVPRGSTLSDATMFGGPVVTRASLSDSMYRVLLALAGPDDATGAAGPPATDEEIATRLFLSDDTVRAHLQILFERFGVATLPPDQRRTALVAMARARGLLLPERER